MQTGRKTKHKALFRNNLNKRNVSYKTAASVPNTKDRLTYIIMLENGCKDAQTENRYFISSKLETAANGK